jgi:hypothetical protein
MNEKFQSREKGNKIEKHIDMVKFNPVAIIIKIT